MSELVIDEILARTDTAGKAWMRGEWSEYRDFIAHDPDVSIFGPFGGPATEGWDAWNAGSQIVIKHFQNGSTTSRLIQSYASDDMVVLVLVEEGRGDIGGLRQDWALRVTQVYQRRDGAWKVVAVAWDNEREGVALSSSLTRREG